MDIKLLNLQNLITSKKLDALLVSSVPNIIYLTNYSAFSYFEREAFLVVSKKKNYLITDGRYKEAVLRIPGFQLLEISNKSSIDYIFKSLSQKIKRLGVENTNISLAESKKLKKYFKIYPINQSENLRIIKEKDEILKIKKACKIGDETFKDILGKIKKGISEKEIALEIEFSIKRKKADISFPPIVAFSKNSSIPHHVPTFKSKLSAFNSIVLLDFGVKFENYCSDMTRTVFIGRVNDKFKKIYNTVLSAQKKTIEFIQSSIVNNKSSILANKVDDIARSYIIKQGFNTIPHSLGHGVGIEVHEPPRLSPNSKEMLKQGMVFSVEPGIYIPGFGGVRIEDLILIRKNNIELLTHSPKDIIEL